MELHWNMTSARITSKTPAFRWRFFVWPGRKRIAPGRWYGVRCDQLTWDIYWFRLLFPLPVETNPPRYNRRFRSRFVRTVQICSFPPPLRFLTMRKRLVFEDVNADFGINKNAERCRICTHLNPYLTKEERHAIIQPSVNGILS